MLNEIQIGLRVCLLTLVLTGIAYPIIVFGIGQTVFNHRANGSIITDRRNHPVGSEWIAQPFHEPYYFHNRPTMVSFDEKIPVSTGSNWGPHSIKLKERIEMERARLLQENPDAPKEIPEELLTASGSGLDPHLSPEAAQWQIHRIAKAPGVESERIEQVINDYTENRTFGMLGEPRINVLKLNLALDEFFGQMTE